MEKYFATYDQSLALKEFGFNEHCLAAFVNKKLKGCGAIYFKVDGLYNNFGTGNEEQPWIAAPTFSQAFEFFREKYGLWFRPDFYDEMKTYDYQGSVHKLGRFSSLASLGNYKTVEELESACVDKFIELVKS